MKKRFLFLIVVLLFGFFLHGCKDDKDILILSIPTNLYFDEEEILRWDKVENATSYVIRIDDKAFETNDNYYDLFEELNEYKTYEIEVYAKDINGKYLESDGSIISYTIDENNLVFTLENDGYVVAKQDPTKIHGKVIIPESYNGITVVGITKSAFEGCTGLKSALIPGCIKSLKTDIFKKCTNLVRVKFSDDIETMPSGTFYECSALKSACLPKSVQKIDSSVYYKCSSLINVYIPDGVKTLQSAFESCDNLESISLPDSIISAFFGSSFSGCHNLSSIEIRGNNERYYTKNNCLIEKKTNKLIIGTINSVIPEEVDTIGYAAFSTRYIKSIEIGPNIKTIEQNAFNLCTKLESVKIDGLKEIPDRAFYSCNNLKSVELKNVETIGSESFSFCDALNSINLDCVKVVKVNAFSRCKNLEEITFSSNLEELNPFTTRCLTNIIIKDNEIYKADNCSVIDKRTATLIIGSNDGYIPEDVKIIGEYSFRECTMTSLIIPEGVEIIGQRAFEKCLFETVKLPSTLKRIEDGAFYNCNNFSHITIPSNVEYIGGGAFTCEKVISIILDGFNGELAKGSIGYSQVYTNVSCENPSEMINNEWWKASLDYSESIIYNTVFKEDNGEKYVYSIDLKHILKFNSEAGYVQCYRTGYEFLGWSFTENSETVDLPIASLIRKVYDPLVAFLVILEIPYYGISKTDYQEKQKEYGKTVLYSVWKKI